MAGLVAVEVVVAGGVVAVAIALAVAVAVAVERGR
jgi:hypothetical protein